MNPVRRLRSASVRRAEPRLSAGPDGVGDALVRSARGDEAAFAEFYDATAALVYGIVLRIVRDPAMSEEVTQEVYVELWRLAPRFDATRGNGRSWASTIAHRRAVDRVRSEEARRQRDSRDANAMPTESADVADAVIEQLDQGRVRRALDALSPSQQQAVSLAYFGGHTYREVAALLDVPEGTVKTRIRDGLIKLRDHFGVAL